MAGLSKLEILKLSSQNSLDILGIDGKDVIATEVAQNEGRDITVFLVADDLDASLGQLRQRFLLVCGKSLLQIVDTEGIFTWKQRQIATAQALSLARVLP